MSAVKSMMMVMVKMVASYLKAGRSSYSGRAVHLPQCVLHYL